MSQKNLDNIHSFSHQVILLNSLLKVDDQEFNESFPILFETAFDVF